MSKQQPPKMQLLDPIGVCCKLILLYFLPSGTRLRIRNHIVELTQPNVAESLIWRNWNGDSREDVCLLFTSIVRFIELYLVNNQKSNEISGENNIEEQEFDCNKTSDGLATENILVNLKKLANYMAMGIPRLEEVYGLTCAGLTLQYYINLLNAGVNETYSKKLLPTYAQDIINQNLIQPDKLRGIWNSEDIWRITNLFDNCFSTKDTEKNKIMLNGYITNIKTILSAKDEEFQQIVGGAF